MPYVRARIHSDTTQTTFRLVNLGKMVLSKQKTIKKQATIAATKKVIYPLCKIYCLRNIKVQMGNTATQQYANQSCWSILHTGIPRMHCNARRKPLGRETKYKHID